MRNKNMLISIVIPCYNENSNLYLTITKLKQFSKELILKDGAFEESPVSRKIDYEFILVNDGSTDETGTVMNTTLEDSRFKVVKYYPNEGKGFALKQGIKESNGDVIWIMDCDMAVRWKDFSNATSKLISSGMSVVYGSRYSVGSCIVNPSWGRLMLGRAFNNLAKFILRLNVEDTQCPCKVIRGDYARISFAKLQTKGFAFDTEFFARARKNNPHTVMMIPVTFNNGGNSKVKVFRDSYQMFRDLFRIWKIIRNERI